MVSVSVRYLFYQPMDEKIKTWTLQSPAKENPNMEIYGPSTSSNLYYGPEKLRPETQILNGFLSIAQQIGYQQRISQALQTLIYKLFIRLNIYAEFVLHKVTLRDEVLIKSLQVRTK